MVGAVQYLVEGYKYLFQDLVHPVSRNWLLTGNLHKLLAILTVYLLFCLRLGPWFMRNRQPYDLKNVIKMYNIFQIFISFYLFVKGSLYVFSGNFNFRCQPMEDPITPEAYEVVSLCHLYYILKVIDLLDTVFFVLRKSDRQITSLHIHHHTLMPLSSWLAVSYFPGGQGVIIGYINSFVHTIMYTYYFIAGLGDGFKKYLWWKKYLTMLQLVQFGIIAVHNIVSLFFECGYPTVLKLLILLYAFVFINMFGQFYYHTYVKSKKSSIQQNGTKKVKYEKSL